MTDKEQMFADDFIAQVIQIVAPSQIHIDITRERPGYSIVRLEFAGRPVGDSDEFRTVVYAKTIGMAMHQVREQLRQHYGK